jgi:hypothetical protein
VRKNAGQAGRAFRPSDSSPGHGARNQQPPRNADRKGRALLKDLAVLTPPLVVCAAFLIGVGAFLRHEMGTGRRQREEDTSVDISDDSRIPGPPGPKAARRDGEDAPDPFDGS